MKLKFLASAATITIMGLLASPSLSQTDINAELNAELKQAVCTQQWRKAINILNRMRARVPQMESQLISYRRQIQTLANSRTRIQQNWPPQYCTVTATNTPAATPQTTPTLPPTIPATTPTISAVKGEVAVNEISAVFRGRTVRGVVVNNTNNPVTNVKINFAIVRNTTADGEPTEERAVETGSQEIAGTIPPGGQVNFEGSVNQRIRGDAKVVSVEWKNTIDNSDGSNPPKLNPQ
ncbi:hypothetical protein IQ264_09635 [Phormidium sp. LEGE 05292]|uniref:hypothetical protein n=1 Tax=[Phormidium] sp. LEGE 05292 TaxID=767427 RepID=UPI00187FAEF1|nr:hypothetical protein [Phormidium sp. LEGE 05292]MBE9225682.1 hypothetical protein [Phormidium sp. LEGE 05292]